MARFVKDTTDRVTGFARWLSIVLLGAVFVVAGIIMMFTPGPGIGFLVLGFYVWAWEFAWARRMLDWLIAKAEAKRHQLPQFVGRLLDERNRRRQIREAADDAAREEAGDEATTEVSLSPGQASDAGA